jgi:hypothetical protein
MESCLGNMFDQRVLDGGAAAGGQGPGRAGHLARAGAGGGLGLGGRGVNHDVADRLWGGIFATVVVATAAVAASVISVIVTVRAAVLRASALPRVFILAVSVFPASV